MRLCPRIIEKCKNAAREDHEESRKIYDEAFRFKAMQQLIRFGFSSTGLEAALVVGIFSSEATTGLLLGTAVVTALAQIGLGYDLISAIQDYIDTSYRPQIADNDKFLNSRIVQCQHLIFERLGFL